MRPLSAFLVSMLQTALKTNATRIDVLLDDERVLWFHGDELVGNGELLHQGMFAQLDEELCVLGAQRGTTSFLSVQSPVGPLGFSVAISARTIRLVLRDELKADAEAAFGELMEHLLSIGADRVTCANGEARFAKGTKAIESVPLVADALPLLVAHGKVLAGLEGTSRSGKAVLFGEGTKRVLGVELVEGGVAFTVDAGVP